MRVAFKSSFDRAYKKLPAQDQEAVDDAIAALQGFVGKSAAPPHGIGMKRLSSEFWEARVGLRLRVLLGIVNDTIAFYFVGDHDAVRRFLQN